MRKAGGRERSEEFIPDSHIGLSPTDFSSLDFSSLSHLTRCSLWLETLCFLQRNLIQALFVDAGDMERYLLFVVMLGQSSVRNGAAGRLSLLKRFASGLSPQAYRTAMGSRILAADTIT